MVLNFPQNKWLKICGTRAYLALEYPIDPSIVAVYLRKKNTGSTLQTYYETSIEESEHVFITKTMNM